jgi:hypothetical protein
MVAERAQAAGRDGWRCQLAFQRQDGVAVDADSVQEQAFSLQVVMQL